MPFTPNDLKYMKEFLHEGHAEFFNEGKRRGYSEALENTIKDLLDFLMSSGKISYWKKENDVYEFKLNPYAECKENVEKC